MRVVIPSVNYADMLAVTLPAWRKTLPEARFTVVTSPEDQATQALAALHQTSLVVTDIWTRDGVPFNKGGALDLAFGITGSRRPPTKGQRCLSLDADVYPCAPFPHDRLQYDVIYGVPRYLCASPELLRGYLAGVVPLAELPLIVPRMRGSDGIVESQATPSQIRHAAKRCLGYFQLFRYYPGLDFGHSRTAGKYDIDFRERFARRRRLEQFHVLHLGGLSRENWSRRVLPAWGDE